MTLRVVEPIKITTANMTSNIAIPSGSDPALWSAIAYTTGQRATYQTEAGIYDIYECIADVSGNKPPPNFPLNWVYVSRVNGLKMFDTQNSSQTVNSGTISITLDLQQVVSVITLFNLTNATSVQVVMTDPVSGVVKNDTYPLQDASSGGWYGYFFDGVKSKSDITIPIPAYKNAEIAVTITGGSNLACGTFAVGKEIVLGDFVLQGATIGIQDFSRKERDQFGEYQFVVRNYSKKADINLLVQTADVDYINNTLARLRATPALYIADSDISSLSIFGTYADFSLNVNYGAESSVSITLEGLT